MKPIDRMCPACKAPAGHPCCPFGVKPGCGYLMKSFHRERHTDEDMTDAPQTADAAAFEASGYPIF